MSTQTEALKQALEQTLEMLNDNREYIEANERAEYLAMYDKVIAGAEKALAEQEEQFEEAVKVLTPQERRDAGEWHCPECFTFGHQHRRGCKAAHGITKGNT